MKKNYLALVPMLALILTTASVAKAADEKPLLMCSTPADALGLVKLYNSGGESYVKVNYSEADEEEVPPVVYKLTSGLKNIAKGDSDTLIGQQVGSELAFGGGIGDALLIRVLPGQKKAVMAAKGWVYYLNCFKN